MASDDSKVSRRGLLALLGLGGAAAAVASKAEAAPSVPPMLTLDAPPMDEAERAKLLAQLRRLDPLLDGCCAIGIDPSAYPRVRVALHEHGWQEYRAAEPLAPGDFVALLPGGYAIRAIGRCNEGIGVCREYIEAPSLRLDSDGLRIDGQRVPLDGCCSIGLPDDWATDALEDYLETHPAARAYGRGLQFRERVQRVLAQRCSSTVVPASFDDADVEER